METNLKVGVSTNSVHDLQQSLEGALALKFDFLAVPLFHPRAHRDASSRRAGPPTRSDLVLNSTGWTRHVVGKVSEWLNLDSECAQVRLSSELAFKQEVAWATHLSVPAVLLPAPGLSCANYARQINQLALSATYLQLWVSVPTSAPCVDESSDSTAAGTVDDDPWSHWNRLRALCDGHPSLGVSLELTADLPPRTAMDRWFGEPVKAVVLPTSIFLTNAKGYPTLSTRHQQLVIRFLSHGVQFIIKGRGRKGEGHSGLLPYLQYVTHLATRRAPLSDGERFVAPYLDFLQAPLQPLMDNLESQTYETFERDPVKYAQYEHAIAAALSLKPCEERVVLMVVRNAALAFACELASFSSVLPVVVMCSRTDARCCAVPPCSLSLSLSLSLSRCHCSPRWGQAAGRLCAVRCVRPPPHSAPCWCTPLKRTPMQ